LGELHSLWNDREVLAAALNLAEADDIIIKNPLFVNQDGGQNNVSVF
jgi:hypothetical protein